MNKKTIPYKDLIQRTDEQGDCLIWTGPIRRGLPHVYTDGYDTYPPSVRKMIVREFKLGCGTRAQRLVMQCGNDLCINKEHFIFPGDAPKPTVDDDWDTEKLFPKTSANRVVKLALNRRDPLFMAFFPANEDARRSA